MVVRLALRTCRCSMYTAIRCDDGSAHMTQLLTGAHMTVRKRNVSKSTIIGNKNTKKSTKCRPGFVAS